MKAAPAAAPRAGGWRTVPAPCRCGEAEADLRCDCGSLLARRVEDGVELKCRRCKRTVVVPLGEG